MGAALGAPHATFAVLKQGTQKAGNNFFATSPPLKRAAERAGYQCRRLRMLQDFFARRTAGPKSALLGQFPRAAT